MAQAQATSAVLTQLVLDALGDLARSMALPGLETAGPDTRLYGPGGTLKSLALVNLIADLEERIYEAYGQEVTLASEKAFSLSRSPFSTVQTLAEYILTLLQAEADG